MFTTSFGTLFSVNFMWDHPVKLNEKVERISVDSGGTASAHIGDKSYVIAYADSVIHWNDPRNGSQEANSLELFLKAANRQNIPVETV